MIIRLIRVMLLAYSAPGLFSTSSIVFLKLSPHPHYTINTKENIYIFKRKLL